MTANELGFKIEALLERLCREYDIPPNAPPYHLLRDKIGDLVALMEDSHSGPVYTLDDAGDSLMFLNVGSVTINIREIASIESGIDTCKVHLTNGKTYDVKGVTMELLLQGVGKVLTVPKQL